MACRHDEAAELELEKFKKTAALRATQLEATNRYEEMDIYPNDRDLLVILEGGGDLQLIRFQLMFLHPVRGRLIDSLLGELTSCQKGVA